jgi:hypothetical protein
MTRDRSIYFVTTALVCGAMAYSAVNFNLARPLGPMKGGFRHLELPTYFRIELSIAKILGVATLLIPGVPSKLKEFAYFGFGLTLVSAGIAHFSVGDKLFFVLDPLVILAAAITSYVYFMRYDRTGKAVN